MTKKTTGTNKSDVQDDHPPNDIIRTSRKAAREKSQLEGPAAYAPHEESEKSNR